ncbi:MAG: efflux transporter outer membrane subunit [Pseudomonadota bacterium]
MQDFLTNSDPARRQAFRTLSRACLFAGVCILSACASVGPDYAAPQISGAERGWAMADDQAAPEDAFIAWWRESGDANLTRLVETALADNLSVREALSRVDEARSLRSSARAAYLPQAQAEASATTLQQSLNGNPGLADFPGFVREFELFDVGGALAWQVDLWGQVRRQNEAADARLSSSVAAANAARLAIAIEVSSTYFNLVGLQQEIAALNAAISAQQDILEFRAMQMDAGALSLADLTPFQSELAALQAQVPPLEGELTAQALALGTLTGNLPESELALLARNAQPIALGDVPLGLRSEILRRRPDINIAERQLAAETAEIGVAKGELFPKLSLNASGGFTATDAGDLIQGNSSRFSVFPLLSWRIFEGGRVRAEIRLAEAEARTAALAYEGAILDALREAETAVATYRKSREALALSRSARDVAQTNMRFTRIRRDAGAISEIQLLDATRQMNEANRAVAQSWRRAAVAMTQLYGALGSGWQSPETSSEQGQGNNEN